MIDLQTAISNIKRSPEEIMKLREIGKKMGKGFCETNGYKKCELCRIANYCYENLQVNILAYQPLLTTPQPGECRYHPIQSVKSRKHLTPGGQVVCFGSSNW